MFAVDWFKSPRRLEVENLFFGIISILPCGVRRIVCGCVGVVRRVRSLGIRDHPTSTCSPWQNGYAERLIGSIRREYLSTMSWYSASGTCGIYCCLT